eukprot:g13451.t1
MNIGQQSSRSARRDEILRARKYEKVMWQIIGRLQQTYEVPVNDRRLQGAITGIIQNTEPQMQGLTLPEQIDRLVQFCEGELQNQNLLVLKQTLQNPSSAYNSYSNEDTNDLVLPYNAKAGDVDPYAAMMLYQSKIAKEKEDKWTAMDRERKKAQMEELNAQVSENRNRITKARQDELKWGVMQREQAKMYEAKLKNDKAQRIRQRNEERAVQSQYKQEWDSIKAKAKQEELNADLAYLQRVENEIEQAKQRDRMMLEQRRAEAEKTRIENELQRGIKMKMLEKEKEEDQERMRQFEANELAKEKRRLADLEAMKKHQSVLMTIGNEAIERQREIDRITDENIERAIRLQDEKARLAQEASEAARKKMIHDTNVWRQHEEASRQAQKKAEWDAEQERLRKMQSEFQRQEELERERQRQNQLAKVQYKQDLMNQMREQQEAKRRSYIEMSPHEAAVNQAVLNKFRRDDEAYTKRGNTMRNAGRSSIIF